MSRRKVIFILAPFLTFGIAAQSTISPTYQALTNAAATGGTFQFSSGGTITVSSPVSIASETIFDANGHTVVLSGNSESSILHLQTNTALTLKGLAFINGLARGLITVRDPFGTVSGTNQAGYGGAIKNFGGSLAIQNCVFSNNFASGTFPDDIGFSRPRPTCDAYGGAIWQIGGSLRIEDSLFVTNRAISTQGSYADAAGGAIFISGANDLRISNVTFGSNIALLASANIRSRIPTVSLPARGGAIAAESTPIELSGAKMFGNTVTAQTGPAFGGALFQTNATLSISNLFAVKNSAFGGSVGDQFGSVPWTSLGGAIFTAGSSTVTHSTFLTNSAASYGSKNMVDPSWKFQVNFGGAVFAEGTAAALNSTYAGNFTEAALNRSSVRIDYPQEAAAFYIAGDAGITNCTFVGHSTGLSTLAATNGGTLFLKNSILANNRFASITNSVIDAGHNLNSEALPQFAAATSTNQINPRLGPLDYYGGLTPVYPLLAGSPAIDAADILGAPATDQRGRARPFGPGPDIGSFESSPPFQVWGTVKGYIDPTTVIAFAGSTFSIGPKGEYRFTLPEGSHSATLSATNARFGPNPWLLHAADGPAPEVKSFQLHSLTADDQAFFLAGHPGEIWSLRASPDLIDWSDLGDYTIPTTGLLSLDPTNNTPRFFLHAIYTPLPQ